MFTDLASELKLEICRFLPSGALSRCSNTSKELHKLISFDTFCQRKLLHDFAVTATFLGKNDSKKFSNLTEIAIAQAKNKDFIGARRTFVLANKAYESSCNRDFYFRAEEKESFKLHIIKIITALIKAGDRGCIIDPEVEGSISVEDHYFRSMIFKKLARSSVEMGNMTKANEFFTLSKDTALSIKDELYTSYKDSALTKIITTQVKAAITLAKTGRIIEANELFVLSKNSLLQVGSNSYKCELLRKIARALAITSHEKGVDEIFALAKEEALLMRSHSCKSLELAKIATTLAEISQKEKSDEFFTLAKDAALIVQRDNNKTLPLQLVVRHQLQAGNIEEAKTTALLMQDFRDLSRMLKKVVKAQIKAITALAKAGQKEEADKFYQLQRDTIEEIKAINISGSDFKHLSIMLKGIVKAQVKAATALARADQKEEADTFFTLSKDTAFSIIGDHNKFLALAGIAAALVEIDQKEARTLCALLKESALLIENNNYKKSLILTKIIPILAKMGQKEEIKELLTSLRNTIIPAVGSFSSKSKALTKLAVALAKTGNTKKANQLFRLSRCETFSIAEDVKSNALKKIVAAQTKIAIALAKSGNIAGVKDLIGNARKMNLSDIDVASIALQAAREININKTS